MYLWAKFVAILSVSHVGIHTNSVCPGLFPHSAWRIQTHSIKKTHKLLCPSHRPTGPLTPNPGVLPIQTLLQVSLNTGRVQSCLLCKCNVKIKLVIKNTYCKVLVWENIYDFCILDLSKNKDVFSATNQFTHLTSSSVCSLCTSQML